jgi:hypothetical protein
MTNAVIQNLTGKLLSPIVNAPIGKGDRYAFRGELGLKFPASIAGEARPPEIKADQVIIAIEGDKIVLLALHLDTLAHLDLVIATLGEFLSPSGKFFIFAGNVDLSKKYQVSKGGFDFNVLPLDEATVYNELLDLLYLERGDLKKMSSEGKVDAILESAVKTSFSGNFPVIPYEQAIAELGPIKIKENRPV